MSKIDDIIDLGFDEAVVFSHPSYEDAIIGVSLDGNVIYDYDKMVEYLMNTESMTSEEAVEWIDYNVIGFMPNFGDSTPILAYSINDEDD